MGGLQRGLQPMRSSVHATANLVLSPGCRAGGAFGVSRCDIVCAVIVQLHSLRSCCISMCNGCLLHGTVACVEVLVAAATGAPCCFQ